METVSCPSGLVGEMRGLKVRDEDALAAAGNTRSGEQINDIFRRCWVKTIDRGVYEKFSDAFDAEGNLSPEGLLIGDRVYLVLALRRLSYGDDLDFQMACPSKRCKKKIGWTFKLSELPIQILPDETRLQLETENLFAVKLPACGKEAKIKLFTGHEEARLAKKQNQKDGNESMSSDMFRQRIISVEGVKQPELPEFILDLEGRDAQAIRDEVERIDCGIDTTVQFECRSCGTPISTEIPFDSSFLGRAGTRRKS